jgi:energy-coupling factor transporter transmembrane protein EcfT
MAQVVEPSDALAGHQRDRLREAWPPLLVLLSGAVVLAVVFLKAPTAVRAAPVLGYIAIVPGLACTRLVRLPDRFTEFVLGVGLSLALGILVAQAMVYLHRWSPPLGLAALVVIASLAASAELYRGPRRPRQLPSRGTS